MKYIYNGYVDIDGAKYSYTFSDFVLSIHIGDRPGQYMGWEKCNQIVNNGWIHIWDLSQNELYLCVERPMYLSPGEYSYAILGYVRLFYLDRKSNRDSPFLCRNLLFKHPVIDFLFDCNDEYIQRIVSLFNSWSDGTEKENMHTGRGTHKFSLSGTEYQIHFPTYCQYKYDAPFPFDIFNAILIEGADIQCVNDVWLIANTVRHFLQLVSQSRIINLDEVSLNFMSSEKPYNAWLYMRPEQNISVSNRERVLKYKDIKECIGNIFDQISRNQIYFRALFNEHDTIIRTYDIMNICAAFEAQFAVIEPKFKDKTQSNTKKKMVNHLMTHRTEYDDTETDYFDVILNGLKNFNDTLRKRLQIALDKFIKIYGEDNIGFDFTPDYRAMPKRIADTRNALDHGNRTYQLTSVMFKDTELLRAITYMLILQKAGMSDSNIRACLKRLSKFPY